MYIALKMYTINRFKDMQTKEEIKSERIGIDYTEYGLLGRSTVCWLNNSK